MSNRGVLVTKWVKSVHELSVVDIPVPQISDTQVLVNVQAIGCNFFDILMVQGKYQIKPQFPFVVGSEFAGVVASVGKNVRNYRVGDHVFGSLSHGSYAEKIAVEEAQLLRMPVSMPFEEAAGFAMVYATSYLGLVYRGKLKKGDWCLVHACAGGVGLAAVQIAKAVGAKVIGTCGSQTKCNIAKEAGADYVINYNETKGAAWVKRVMEITDGHGADVVYDPVGADVFDLSTKCIAWQGRLLVVGFTGGRIPKIAANRILLKNISVVGVFLGSHLIRQPRDFRDIMKALNDLYERNLIKPKVYQPVYDLDHFQEALTAIASRASYGKVILRTTPNSKL